MNNNDKKLNKVEENPLHPFLTPDGYFEQFKMDLMEKIKDEEQVEALPVRNPKWSAKRLLIPFVAAAAVIAAVLVFNFNRVDTTPMGLMDMEALQKELLSEEEFEEFLYEETAEDYWGLMVLDDEDL